MFPYPISSNVSISYLYHHCPARDCLRCPALLSMSWLKLLVYMIPRRPNIAFPGQEVQRMWVNIFTVPLPDSDAPLFIGKGVIESEDRRQVLLRQQLC